MATSAIGNIVRVISVKQNVVMFELGHEMLHIPNALSKFAISPDGRYVVIGNVQGAIFIFNLSSGELEEIFEEHTMTVFGIDWASNSDSTIATIDKSGLLYLWN